MESAWKDEADGRQIVEFVRLRAKFYSHKLLDESEKKNYKRVSKNVVKRVLKLMTIDRAYLANTTTIEK